VRRPSLPCQMGRCHHSKDAVGGAGTPPGRTASPSRATLQLVGPAGPFLSVVQAVAVAAEPAWVGCGPGEQGSRAGVGAAGLVQAILICIGEQPCVRGGPSNTGRDLPRPSPAGSRPHRKHDRGLLPLGLLCWPSPAGTTGPRALGEAGRPSRRYSSG
jgi:hypothetical protein